MLSSLAENEDDDEDKYDFKTHAPTPSCPTKPWRRWIP
jgi:hypothetical protein